MPPRRGRPDLGKTATIKDRSVYIYAPTEEMVATWKKEAKRYGLPLSGAIGIGVSIVAFGIGFWGAYEAVH